MECVVEGLIEQEHVAALEVLLQALSGHPKEVIKSHEIRLRSGPNLGAVPSELQLVCDLARGEGVWKVRHVGGALRGAGAEQLPALVRTVLESKISPNALRFLYILGFKLDTETLKTGSLFRFFRGVPITASVTAVHKIPKLHALSEAVPCNPGLHLVEVRATSTVENYNEAVAAMSAFAELVAPLITLSKPGVVPSFVPTAATAAATLMSREAIK